MQLACKIDRTCVERKKQIKLKLYHDFEKLNTVIFTMRSFSQCPLLYSWWINLKEIDEEILHDMVLKNVIT